MHLTQNQKESLISLIDDYHSYSIEFRPLEDEYKFGYYKNIKFILKISKFDTEFYVGFTEEKIKFFYLNRVLDEAPTSFLRSSKKNDLIFDLFSFCIEEEIPFAYKYELLRVYTPFRGRYFLFENKASGDVINKIKDFVLEDSQKINTDI